MLTLSNALSFIRFPLAFAFLSSDPLVRAVAIILAGCSDGLDGYCARRFRTVSQFGASLDPLMDKFFVAFALIVFLNEGGLGTGQLVALLSRDIAVGLYGVYLVCNGWWSKYEVRSIWSGKVTTTLQLAVLLALTFHYPIPSNTYYVFVVLGFFAFFELCWRVNKTVDAS